MKYIAYGSNMVAEQMACRCPNAKPIGKGYIERARLEFYLHATVEYTRRKNDHVPVVVWEIDDEDENRLDFYEGYPSYYIKRNWVVRMNDGSKLKGMIYLMKLIRPHTPMKSYYNAIRDAYEDMGFESEIATVLEPARQRSQSRGKHK